ncbi:MAG: BMC domain-containing protein [Myxococcota bacterium]|nr:BMC domain-containing protein [Myxococcota bacterium]
MSTEALSLIAFASLARGLRALDALVKKAPVEVLEANLVEPGKFLVLIAGGVGEVEEAHAEALLIGDDEVVGAMLLADAHPALLAGLRGHVARLSADELDCLGVIEGKAIPVTLHAADRAIKDANVTLAGLRLTGGLGGRAYFIVYGAQHDVEASIEAAENILGDACHRTERIARPHAEMVAWLLRPAPFHLPQA